MNGALGNDFELARLYWARDNLGQTMYISNISFSYVTIELK